MLKSCLLATSLAFAVAAQAEEPKGSHDYALIQRFPHSQMNAFEERAWDRVTSVDAKGVPVKFEGRSLAIGYRIEKGQDIPSALEMMRNYENALTAGGWTLELQSPNRISAKLEKDGREIWAVITYDAAWGDLAFHIAEKAPMPILIEQGKPQAIKSTRADAAGAKDYPAFPRLPHQFVRSHDEKKFDQFNFPMGDGGRHHAEGRKIFIDYGIDKLPDGVTPPSAWEAHQNYLAVLTGEGWAVFNGDAGHITAVLRDGDQETWAQLVYDGAWGTTQLTIVEPGEFKQVVTANSLLDQLKAEGKLSFDVHFDTGTDAIKPESRPVVAQMVELLKSDAKLKIEVAGHTDNSGNESENLALSQRRAAAVMDALRTGGIDAARMTSKGYGQSKPLADNGSTGGRALNRRVELVRR